MVKRKNMKNSLLSYCFIPLIFLGISKMGICDTFVTNALRKTLNFDAKQCEKKLPDDLHNARKYFANIHIDRNIPDYYLMAKLGQDHKRFLSYNQELFDGLKNPLANSQSIIEKLSQRLADSVVDAIEVTRTTVEREHLNLIQGPGGISTYMESSEVFAAFPAHSVTSTKTLEDNSQLIITLLQNSRIYSNSVSAADTSTTASYLYTKLGLPVESYPGWRDDFFESSTLFNEKANPLHQLARFISYLAVRNQFDGLVNALTAWKGCESQDKKAACGSAHDLILAIMQNASEQLVITFGDWLTKPEKVQPCFSAGCDSWFWYPALAIWSVKPVQHNAKPYQTRSDLTYWYQLAHKNPDKANAAIQSFSRYMENNTCWEYGSQDY